MTISSFSRTYRFLSNFWPATVELDGDQYPTVEHAYQAAKTADTHGSTKRVTLCWWRRTMTYRDPWPWKSFSPHVVSINPDRIPVTREDIINYVNDLVSRSILDNFEDLTKSQLEDYVFEIIFDGLDSIGVFDRFPDVEDR